MKGYTFLKDCAFGNYMIDLLDKKSSLYTGKSEIIVLFLDWGLVIF
jgi:hypothetical protein